LLLRRLFCRQKSHCLARTYSNKSQPKPTHGHNQVDGHVLHNHSPITNTTLLTFPTIPPAAAQPLLIPPPMHPLTTTTTSFLLTLFLSLHLTTSLPSNDIGNLSNCNQNFSCGNLTNVTYPFTGGPRPSHCGPPEFGLTCEDESVTILKANSLSYRVIHLDQTSQTLRLSRSDLYDDGKCTRQFTNTTLDDRIFSLGSSHELYLFYGCKKIDDSVMGSDQLPKISRFSCDNHGVTEEGFFSIVYPYGTEYSFPNTFECQTNIRVPIPSTRAQQLFDNESVVGEVLKEGFDVSYSNPYNANCTKCYKEHPGGYCGFDTQLGKPICICNDRLCPGKQKSLVFMSLFGEPYWGN